MVEEERLEELEVDEEERTSLDLSAPPRKLFTVLIRPHEGNPSDYPYCITPQQIVCIPLHNSAVNLL